MIIKFKNWDKHQCSEIKKAVNPYWLKFRNDFFADPKIFELDSEEIVTLLYMLCEASKAHKNGQFFLSHSHYRIFTRKSSQVLSRAMEKLKSLQIIEIRQSTGSWAKVDGNPSQNRIEENRIEENRIEKNTSSEPKNPAHEQFVVLSEFSELKFQIEDRNIPEKVQRAWLLAYPNAPWIVQEIKEALAWEMTNPQKKKKNFSRFMGNWLGRNWDKSTGSRVDTQDRKFKTKAEQISDYNAEMDRKIMAGEV